MVDQIAGRVELTLWDSEVAGWSVDVTPAEWAQVVEKAESLPAMLEYRRARSVEAAREAQSHDARRSRR